jgi:hypothetical protein
MSKNARRGPHSPAAKKTSKATHYAEVRETLERLQCAKEQLDHLKAVSMDTDAKDFQDAKAAYHLALANFKAVIARIFPIEV